MEVKPLPCLVNLISQRVLLFDQGLSNDRLLMTEGYLAHKWGIDDLITVSHHHKNNPPVFENRPEILLNSPYSIGLGVEQNFTISNQSSSLIVFRHWVTSGMS